MTPNPAFKVTVYLQVEYLKKRCVLGTKLLKNTNRKPYTIYRIVPLSMTLIDLWPRFQGHDIFWSRMSYLNTNLLSHNRKLYLTYGMVLYVWWRWLTCVAQVCQHQLSFSFFNAHTITTLSSRADNTCCSQQICKSSASDKSVSIRQT